MNSEKSVRTTKCFESTKNVDRLHPEIANAIRRQRETTGVDYRKDSNLYKGMVIMGDAKLNNPLHSINFQFPDFGYIPVTDQKFSRQTLYRPVKKKVDNILGFRSLNRSQSSIDLTIPGIGDKNSAKSGELYTTLNKASVTDLTCLQLADTLFNSTQTSAGIYGFSTGKSKHMEHVEESVMPVVKPPNSNEITLLKDKESSVENSKPAVSDPNQILPTIKHIKPTVKMVPQKVKIQKPPVRIIPRDCVNSNKTEKVSNGNICETKNTERKSILKPRNTMDKVRSTPETPAANDSEKKSEPEPKPSWASFRYNKVIKNDLQTSKSGRIQFDHNACVTIRASDRVNTNGYTRYALGSVKNNFIKRSVRFNKSDEVFEFSPLEPLVTS